MRADLPDRPARSATPRARGRRAIVAALGVLDRLRTVLAGHGPVGDTAGLASGALALALAAMSVLAVAAFRFPEYLTTPLLRARYDVDALRALLFAAMLASAAIALFNLVAGRQRPLAGAALAGVLGAAALGGAWVPVGDIPAGTPYIGLDWFVLDLLASTGLFVALERLRPLHPGQPVFREEWQTDLAWFALNHLLVGIVLLAVNLLVHASFGWLVHDRLRSAVGTLHFAPALLACLIVADLVQYWVHRAFHEVPWLWRFHAIHHSVRTIDWLAGSRLHVLEVVATRAAVLGPLYVLGFSREVMDAYIVIVGLQAVLIHANLRLRLGPLELLWATPRWHHWHHASDEAALDRNYAINFPLLDHLFGTAVRVDAHAMPRGYGLRGEQVPKGLLAQLLHPLRRPR